jgi:hypothetical protein
LDSSLPLTPCVLETLPAVPPKCIHNPSILTTFPANRLSYHCRLLPRIWHSPPPTPQSTPTITAGLLPYPEWSPHPQEGLQEASNTSRLQNLSHHGILELSTSRTAALLCLACPEAFALVFPLCLGHSLHRHLNGQYPQLFHVFCSNVTCSLGFLLVTLFKIMISTPSPMILLYFIFVT